MSNVEPPVDPAQPQQPQVPEPIQPPEQPIQPPYLPEQPQQYYQAPQPPQVPFGQQPYVPGQPYQEAPPVYPPAPSAAKGLAIAALVVGIVAILLSFFPVVGIVLGIVAVILGIIALVKRQPKGFALTGLILGAVGLIVSLLITMLAGFFASAVLESVKNETSVNVNTDAAKPAETTEEESEPEAPAGKAGTRENPVPLGTAIEGREYTVVINSVGLGQTAAVLAANPFNDEPPAGTSYAVINYTVTYTGTDSGNAVMVRVDYVTAAGNVVDGTEAFAVAPDPSIGLDELYPGASVTGNTLLALPDGDAGVLRVRAGIISDQVFVAIK